MNVSNRINTIALLQITLLWNGWKVLYDLIWSIISVYHIVTYNYKNLYYTLSGFMTLEY
jgi:hypothetical protein